VTSDTGAPAIVVHGLEKRYDLTGPVPFAPARSIYNRVIGRRHRVAGSGVLDEAVDEEELEEDEELEDALEEEAHRHAAAAGERPYAIRDVSFELDTGVFAGVLGGSGAGKSTLIRLLAGVSVPTAGRATLRGVVVPPPQLLSTFMRPDFNVGQNLRLAARLFGIPHRVVRARSEAILDFAGMTSKAAVDPRSAGETFRRLGMAIAVGAAPDVLLLDEVPRVADEEYGSRFVETLAALPAGGTTVLLATRSEHAASVLCRELLVLREGRLVEHARSADHVAADATPDGASQALAWPEPDMTGEMLSRRELRPGGRTHPLLPDGKPGWPGIGFHQWAGLLAVTVRDATGADVTRIPPQDELVVEFGVETGVRALQIHWSVSFLSEDGADISVEEDMPRRYAERTVSTVTVRIAPGTLRPGAFVGRVDGLISAVGRTYTIRRDAFALVVEGDPEQAATGLESLGPVVAERSSSTWSVRGVPSPELVLGRDEPTLRH
jgi:ABC-type polysaccharide/polyol phosphate transport system ATPase subunit